MENETNISINLNRGGFLNLIDAENFIRETITRYETLGPLFIGGYSEVQYHNGQWRVNVTLTTRDPNTVTNVLDFGGPADGNW
jgi:hypothetical protein